MSVCPLDALLAPDSVAVIGASERPGRLGATVWRNLREGGFGGPLYPVNRRHAQVGAAAAWRRVADLPHAPALALLCTPPATVPRLIHQLGRRGTRAAIVLSAGLDPATRHAMLDAARPHALRILGPGSLGLLAPHHGLNASAAHIGALPGGLALVAPSASLTAAVLDWAAPLGIGFSHVVSPGEGADVGSAELLGHLGRDPRTRAILLCPGRPIDCDPACLAAAREAARRKPVVVLGGHAAAPAGLLHVRTLHELCLAAHVLVRFGDGAPPTHLTVLANSHGAATLAAGEAAAQGVPLAIAPPLPHDAPAAQQAAAAETLLREDSADGALLFIHTPSPAVPAAGIAQALLPLASAMPRRVLACWLGGPAVAAARRVCDGGSLPHFDTPEEAVRAFALLRACRQGHPEAAKLRAWIP